MAAAMPVSWQGKHHFLAMTQKHTTGAPHFIETGHLEPAPVGEEMLARVKEIVFHALDSLQIKNGASHSELKIADNGTIRIIEIGGRMGGDFIGSNLVELTTGIDFVRAVIQIALGEEPDLERKHEPAAAAVRFVFGKEDLAVLERLKKEHPAYLVYEDVAEVEEREVSDSSARFGCFLMSAPSGEELEQYLPECEPVSGC